MAVGGGAVLLCIAAWLLRSVITHKLALEVETFKTKLNSKTDVEIERLKNSLEMAALEHEVLFSKLHEHRASVIADLYERMVKLFRECYFFVNTSEGENDPGQVERYNKAADHVGEFAYFVEVHEIYLTERVCERLQEFLKPLGAAVHIAGIYGRRRYDEKGMDAFTKAYEKFERDIPDAKQVLKNEFRKILGVKAQVESTKNPTQI